MNAYELADELEDVDAPRYREIAANMLRQQADRIAELEKQGEPVAWLNGNEICPEIGYEATITTQHPKDLGWKPLYLAPQTKPLSDEVLNKAFDYYCETDEGVLRFDFELRAEWKQEQLKRWKEAFRKAWD